MNDNEILTNVDLAWLKQVQVSTDTIELERLVQAAEPLADTSLLVAEAQGRVRLSDATRRAEEIRLMKLDRKKKALRERKRYTRKRGSVHPKKKEATRRRLQERQWATRPFACLLHGYGAKALDKSLWDLYIAPLWKQYAPAELEVVKYRGFGTKAKPLTVYSLDIKHRTLGVLYSGRNQELYDISKPKPQASHSERSDVSS